jgi:hypothetical protein
MQLMKGISLFTLGNLICHSIVLYLVNEVEFSSGVGNFDPFLLHLMQCNPSGEVVHLGALSQETLYGVRDPGESLEMTRTKKQSTEAAVREIRRRTLPKHATILTS